MDEKEKNIYKELDELQLRWKAAFRAGSNQVLSCIPKTACLISAYPIAPMSPGLDFACRANRSGAVKSPMSIIPKEAMNSKRDDAIEPPEPTSPKVSCIGQVKKKKLACKEKHRRRDRSPLPSSPGEMKISKLKSCFSAKKMTGPVFCDSPDVEQKDSPTLGQMKRFTSVRQCEALRNVYRDSQKLPERCSEEKDAKISSMVFYSGLVIETGNRTGKAEVNLWKRRSVGPPAALNLQSSHGLETRLPLTR